jgi:ribosomal protein S18 acetylase RimI-like enzyme
MPQELEFHRVTATELPIVSYLCLWGIGKQQKDAMKEHMEKRLKWIEEMWSKGLEIIVALSPKKSKKGLIEYMPIEEAPEPAKGKSSLFINCIWVLPRFKKMGIGEGLMQHFLDDAKRVGGATVLSYEGDKWFGYFDYMPTSFFKRFGFKEVTRDETRVLLHLDLGAHKIPKLLPPRSQRIEKKGKTVIDIFCNSQCPWCGWMADEIRRKARQPDIILRQINTDNRGVIEEYGLARGISINGEPTIKRMAPWEEIKSALEKTTSARMQTTLMKQKDLPKTVQ